jgi:peptidoglycan-associated lipoprotein
MFKKFLCLLAVLVLVTACESSSTDNGTGAAGGAGAGTTSGGMGAGGKGQVPGSEGDLTVNVGDRVFFEFNSSDMTEEARATLDRQAAWLKKYSSVSVTVEGHCDERGTREYNLALGDRRATAAKNYLVADGISPDRVKTISYGKERPAVLGHNEAAWAQNRRAVTVVGQ